MKVQAVATLLPIFAGLGAADYKLWSGYCYSFGSNYELYTATQRTNACKGQGWSGLLGASTGSGRNPCNANEKLEYRRVAHESYDIFRDNKKVGNCIAFDDQKTDQDCRTGLFDADVCYMAAFYNCRTPICNSWQ